MKIYTKTGDTGETALYGGERVAKNHPRVECCGGVDELNAVLGVVRTELAGIDPSPQSIDDLLARVQNELFDLGAELASPQPAERGTELLGAREIEGLEQAIDHYEAQLPPLKVFILPGGSPAAARLHVARCVCRRAERELVTLAGQAKLRRETLVYLNRLSDLLFVLARTANQIVGAEDNPWQKGGGS